MTVECESRGAGAAERSRCSAPDKANQPGNTIESEAHEREIQVNIVACDSIGFSP